MVQTLQQWTPIAEAAGIQSGEMFATELAGRPIVVYNVNGTFYATDNACTHASAALSDGWLDDFEIECPLHRGRFDIRTGKALTSPAECDLRTYETRIVEGRVEVLSNAAA